MNKLIFLLLLPCMVFAQDTFKMKKKADNPNKGTTLDINEFIKGTLLMPDASDPAPLVILLTGSGPNDRNGNSMMTRNDSHKQLAIALRDNGIASYRYDKRSFTLVKERKPTDDITFDSFVLDAKTVISHFANDKRFSSITLAGHSQGSLVAMLAMNENIDGFISIAGPADSIDQSIVEQVAAQAPGLDKELEQVFSKMRSQDSLVSGINPYIAHLVGPQVQPFMKSWMVYNPKDLIKDIDVPVLILNGTRDRQVNESQAQKLHDALPVSKLVIIEGMNHVFKKVGDDDVEAAKSYQDPSFPLHPKLVSSIVEFVKK